MLLEQQRMVLPDRLRVQLVRENESSEFCAACILPLSFKHLRSRAPRSPGTCPGHERPSSLRNTSWRSRKVFLVAALVAALRSVTRVGSIKPARRGVVPCVQAAGEGVLAIVALLDPQSNRRFPGHTRPALPSERSADLPFALHLQLWQVIVERRMESKS